MSLTQNDLQAIQQIVQTTVQPMIDGAVDMLAQSTAAGFAEVHEKLVQHDEQFVGIRTNLNRIENKLNATIDHVEGHEVRLTQLEAHEV